MNHDAKIYVAGHTGLVGSALMRALTEAGFNNIVTRDFAELDLRRQQEVEDFFAAEQPDYVFLAAAKVGGILANATYPADFIYDNLMIATNVIHVAYRFKVKKLLNLGSSCIYPKNAPQPLKEEYLLTGPLEETNEPYALAKIAAIKLCRYYNQQYGTQFISLMPTNLYGPNDNFNFETAHVLPALLRKFHLAQLLAAGDMRAVRTDCMRYSLGFGINVVKMDDAQLIVVLKQLGITAEAVTLWGSGKVYREFLHVDDLASAALFFTRMSEPILSECINVGSGVDLTINELASMIRGVVGFNGSIVYDSTKPDGTARKVLDCSLLKSYGVVLDVITKERLAVLYDWYRSKKYFEVIAPTCLNIENV